MDSIRSQQSAYESESPWDDLQAIDERNDAEERERREEDYDDE